MFVKEFNKRLSDIDREILLYIKDRMSAVEKELRDYIIKTSKYSIGYKFNHPKYGSDCIIIDYMIDLGKEDNMSFNEYTDVIFGIDYYKPYYMYIVNSDKFKGVCLTEFDINEGLNND